MNEQFSRKKWRELILRDTILSSLNGTVRNHYWSFQEYPKTTITTKKLHNQLNYTTSNTENDHHKTAGWKFRNDPGTTSTFDRIVRKRRTGFMRSRPLRGTFPLNCSARKRLLHRLVNTKWVHILSRPAGAKRDPPEPPVPSPGPMGRNIDNNNAYVTASFALCVS